MTGRSRIDDSRCKWLRSASGGAAASSGAAAAASQSTTIAPRAAGNNSWYTGEAGESHDTVRNGTIPTLQPLHRPAWDRQDRYTQARNPAHDPHRYAYVDDCTDERRRDWVHRFAVTRAQQHQPGLFTVLPRLAGVRPTTRNGGGLIHTARATTTYDGSGPSSAGFGGPAEDPMPSTGRATTAPAMVRSLQCRLTFDGKPIPGA